MVTNVEIRTMDAPATVYLADGSTEIIGSNEQKFLQMPAGSFLSIGEGVPDDPTFREKMKLFWDKLWSELGQEVRPEEPSGPMPVE